MLLGCFIQKVKNIHILQKSFVLSSILNSFQFQDDFERTWNWKEFFLFLSKLMKRLKKQKSRRIEYLMWIRKRFQMKNKNKNENNILWHINVLLFPIKDALGSKTWGVGTLMCLPKFYYGGQRVHYVVKNILFLGFIAFWFAKSNLLLRVPLALYPYLPHVQLCFSLNKYSSNIRIFDKTKTSLS